MKISSIAVAAAFLPNAAWSQLEAAPRLRASRSLVEDLTAFGDGMSLPPTSISLQYLGHGGEHDSKSSKGPVHDSKSSKEPVHDSKSVKGTDHGSKSGKGNKGAKSGKSVMDPMDLCTEHYPTLDLSEAYQPLHTPPQIYPDKDGVTRLDLVWNLAYYHGPSFSTIIRNYNGGFPGPTIHVAQGGSLELKYINCMHLPLGFSGHESHNRYHLPNSTNLHTHGPHITAKDPGDNVFVKINPREYHDYMYEFNNNHMPGTFWYHPHLHGATALHTGSGSSGMLIMDDPEDYDIPAAIKDMPDVQIVFQHMNLLILRDSAMVSQDNVTNWSDYNFKITNKTTDLTNIMLANMQFLPKVTMEQGKWYRWRTVMSSIQVGIAFESASGNCEMKLLAKDGIYLNDAPRDVEAVILSAGNRADVAIRCNELGQEYMNSRAVDLLTGFGGFDPGGQYSQESDEDPPVDQVVGTFVDPELQPTILVIDVVPNQDVQDDDIEPFTTPTPCYLVDLTGVEESVINTTFTIEYSCKHNENPPWPGRTTPLDICGVWGPYGVGGNSSEFTPWVDEDTYINDFATGTVQELEHPGNAFHPYHQHINPYQIVSLGGTLYPIAADWYKVGDWHDTLQLPLARFGGGERIGRPRMRFQADQFTGHMVQHCHLLFHEDQGMMAQYNVTGVEGAVWPGAKLIDPQCIPAS